MEAKIINQLAAVPAPNQSSHKNRTGDLNAQIYALEEKLSIQHRPPIFNPIRAEARIAALMEIGGSPTPVAAPVAVVLPSALPPTRMQMPPADVRQTEVKNSIASNVKSLTEFLQMNAADANHFALNGGKLSREDYFKLNPVAQLAFVKSGGKIADESAEKATASTASAVPDISLATRSALNRQQFNQLTPGDQFAFCQRNGVIHD